MDGLTLFRARKELAFEIAHQAIKDYEACPWWRLLARRRLRNAATAYATTAAFEVKLCMLLEEQVEKRMRENLEKMKQHFEQQVMGT